MEFPIRCFTCGKTLKSWEQYNSLLKEGKNIDEALDSLKMYRFCCRIRYRSFNKQLSDDLLTYISPKETRDAEVFLSPD